MAKAVHSKKTCPVVYKSALFPYIEIHVQTAAGICLAVFILLISNGNRPCK